MYWTADQWFEFLPPDRAAFPIALRLANGEITMAAPDMRCTIEPAHDNDGCPLPGIGQVTLIRSGQPVYQLRYRSDTYLQMAGSDFTASAGMESLADWDFFCRAQTRH